MNSLTASLLASILFVASAWGPAAAHLLELPNKIHLSRDAYLTVQQIYRGWDLLGIVVLGELISTGALAWLARGASWARLAWAPFACVVAAQLLFWTLTFPTNRATDNWTSLPPEWTRLRAQWEYSHAIAAVLTLVALLVLLRITGRMLAERTSRSIARSSE